MRILLVEDDQIRRISGRDRLAQNGWQVDVASDGEIAVDMFYRASCQLILSDVKTPHLDCSASVVKICGRR